jgi:voltage-gated potassium channel Kch
MQAVGLSPALGTFLAGVVLAESEYRHELESNIEPFKGLLLGLFFLAVGASINFNLVSADPGLIAALVALLIGIKLAVLMLLGKVFKLPLADNLMFSFMLAQGGEFAFLLFSFATQNHVLDHDLANTLVVVVVLSMAITPLLVIVYEKLIQPLFARQFEPDQEREIDAGEQPVIVAGFGRFGQIASRMLTANGIKTTLLDHDAAQIEMTGRFGYKVFYGDASRSELLRAAGAATARLLIIAIDERDKAVQMIHTAHLHFPNLKLLARAFDRRHAYQLIEAGADVIIRETFGSALLMGEQALRLMGYPQEKAYRIMRKFKRYDEDRLIKLYEVWGDDQAYGLRVRQSIEDLEKVLAEDSDDLREIP